METNESIVNPSTNIYELLKKVEDLESALLTITNDFKNTLESQEKRLDKAAHFLLAQNKELSLLKEKNNDNYIESIPCQSEETSELLSALSHAVIEYIYEDLNRKGQYGNGYSDVYQIISCTKQALVNHGLAFYQEIKTIRNKIYLISELSHKESKQWKKSVLELIVDNKRTTKDENQNFGSAITYAKRYAMSTMLNFALKNDPLDNDSGRFKK